jgi:hypothetical protein
MTTSVLIVTNSEQRSGVDAIYHQHRPACVTAKTRSGTGKNVAGIVGGVFGGLAGVVLLVTVHMRAISNLFLFVPRQAMLLKIDKILHTCQ